MVPVCRLESLAPRLRACPPTAQTRFPNTKAVQSHQANQFIFSYPWLHCNQYVTATCIPESLSPIMDPSNIPHHPEYPISRLLHSVLIVFRYPQTPLITHQSCDILPFVSQNQP